MRERSYGLAIGAGLVTATLVGGAATIAGALLHAGGYMSLDLSRGLMAGAGLGAFAVAFLTELHTGK